jgi:hypothetical protein
MENLMKLLVFSFVLRTAAKMFWPGRISVALLVLSAGAAVAQSSQPWINNSGKDCFDYYLNVVTLNDNNHQMFWRQSDCIRVNVINNPFVYTYKLTFDEKIIVEDDVIGSLGSLLGLKTIGSSTTASAKPKTSAPPQNAVSELEFNFAPKNGLPAGQCSSSEIAQLRQAISGAGNEVQAITQQITAAEALVENLKNAASDLTKQLSDKENAYRAFEIDYLTKRQFLRNPATDITLLRPVGEKLQADSLNLFNTLTRDKAFEGAFVNKFEMARLIANSFNALNDRISKQQNQLQACKPPANQKILADQQSAALAQLSSLSDRTSADLIQVQQYAAQIANTVCQYNARKQGEFSWVRDQVYVPVSAVFANPEAFGYIAVKREGPDGDPTSVIMTLSRDAIIDKSSITIPADDNSPLQCESDPSKVLDPSKSIATLADLPAPEAKTKDGAANRVTPKPSQTGSDQTKTASENTQQSTTVVLQQPWFFGKARLVLSGGLTTGFLVKEQFQRSSSITGTGAGATSSTVIGLSNDTRYRLAPMLYGHTLLGSAHHDSDAWYATLGITANSDNKGTDPEFLLGGSRSFAQEKFFFTLGAYIGERQKLDGGLQVGQTIPSTLTGDLPVTKSYHASWGFGISYRFTSTKAPQNSSSQSKPASGTPKKSGS